MRTEINSGSALVTPENMYSTELEKLLFPFNTIKTIKTTKTDENQQ